MSQTLSECDSSGYNVLHNSWLINALVKNIYCTKEKQSQQLLYSNQDITLHIVFCIPGLT